MKLASEGSRHLILSKSKLLAYRQCPKRLWLEIHSPDLCSEVSTATEAVMKTGHDVGELARKLYDPRQKGTLINRENVDLKSVFDLTADLLNSAKPVFEAGFAWGGAMVFADILLPMHRRGSLFWRVVEVKSSTGVKDYHLDDVAVQAYVTKGVGVPLTSITIAHIDNEWVYPGDGNYNGIFKELDLTKEAFNLEDDVKAWIADAQSIVAKRKAPHLSTGRHCFDPFECEFFEYCQGKEVQAKYPVSWLPRVQSKELRALIDEEGVTDMRDVPDDLLNERQLRVKKHTLSGKLYFDQEGARCALRAYNLPAYFLDFETIYFAIPIWKGTRPYLFRKIAHK